ncbi:MAG: DUF6763 family protein [Nevskiales bacterium]
MSRLIQEVSVGDWFRLPVGAPPFEVVAVDVDSETIDIQHFDGTLEEIDFDNWLEMELIPCEQPEDSVASMDMEREDMGTGSDAQYEQLGSPLDDLDRLDSGASLLE